MDCNLPLSMECSKQEYWGGLPFPSPWDLLDPGMEPGSSALQADSLLSEPPGKSFQKEKVDDSLCSDGEGRWKRYRSRLIKTTICVNP